MIIRKYKKGIAVFLLLNFLTTTFVPILLYAEDNPTTEEYETFVPSGNTNLVDTRTGDFHYNISLFDVPGPEGNYPIHLFYNAGIQPDQNSSWTGLGWNLNVGAITRQVKDIPDDFSGQPYSTLDTNSITDHNDDRYDQSAQIASRLANADAGTALFQPFSPARDIHQYGVLHGDMIWNDFTAATSFDCHAMYSEENISSFANPEMADGGSMPSYDIYSVNAEGISGQIEPLLLENGTLFRSTDTGSLAYKNHYFYKGVRNYKIQKNFTQSKPSFRFKKEFSNSFIANSVNSYTSTTASNGQSSTALALGSNNLAYTYALKDVNGFNASSMRLAGGKHVDYFTNYEIVTGTAKSNGFLDYPYFITDNGGYASASSERRTVNFLSTPYDVTRRVGGFCITNEEGITFHYALPAYSYMNVTNKIVQKYSETTGNDITITRTSTNAHPYAYSWLLTTVTGSDYVDKNGNGYADEGDLGLWTNFNYGKATAGYLERSPYISQDYEYSMDGTGINTSEYKEVYYLDATYTRTHSALFSKAFRTDALDANGAINGVSSAYKLNSVILLHNDGIKTIATGMGWTYSNLYAAIKNIKSANYSYNNNIITQEDINALSIVSNAAYANQVLKESKFTYDYSLCPGAPSGTKLTLKSVCTYGRNNIPLGPSTDFSYELSNPKTASITITYTNTTSLASRAGTISVVPGVFSEGDILKFTIGTTTYFCTLLKATSSTTFKVQWLGSIIPKGAQLNQSTIAYQTKNPPYTAGSAGTTHGQENPMAFGTFEDEWGYFKSDMTFDEKNIRDLQTSNLSSKSTDVWSLRQITTSAGAKININYESDSYYDQQMTQGQIFNILPEFRYTSNITHSLSSTAQKYCRYDHIDNSATTGVFEFSIREDITGRFSVGQKINLTSMGTISDGTNNIIYENGHYVSYPHAEGELGMDQFQITLVDETNRKIQGKFINPANGSKSNPFFSGTLPFGFNIYEFFHNSSYLSQRSPTVAYGGGIRVSSIIFSEGSGETYTTNYNYTNRYSGFTSGTTAYEPLLEQQLYFAPLEEDGTYTDNAEYPGLTFNEMESGGDLSYAMRTYEKDNYDVVGKAMANVDFVSPNVLYEFVTISHTGNNNTFLKSQEYNYKPYTWDCIKRIKENESTINNAWGTGIDELLAKVTIQDYTSSVGQLLNYTEYDANGNPTFQTSYTYQSSSPSGQGRLDEVFHEERLPDYFDSGLEVVWRRFVAIVCVRSEYPSSISRVTTTDYLKNIIAVKDVNAFDFYSGDLTEIVTKTSEGDYYKQRYVPAYTKSSYASMGSKFLNSLNKNMLSQTTAAYTFKVNASDYTSHIDTLGCAINTWSNNWSKRAFNAAQSVYYDSTITTDNIATVQDDRIWRKQCNYIWKSPVMNVDGSYKNFVEYNWNSAVQNKNWQRADSVSKYDQFSHIIEKADINNNYTTSQYGYNLAYPLTESNNASIAELTYSGAEDRISGNLYGSTGYFGGEVSVGNGIQDNTYAHSGTYSLRLPANGQGFTYKQKINASSSSASTGKPYRATVWIYDNGCNTGELYYKIQDPSGADVSGSKVSVSLSTTTSPVTVGRWKQLTLDFTLTGVYYNYYLVVGCNNPSPINAYFDDFRFHPLSQAISSNVYDVSSGLVIYSLDKNNFYFKRVYDNAYRPVVDYKETIYGEIKTKEYQYNYGKGQ